MVPTDPEYLVGFDMPGLVIPISPWEAAKWTEWVTQLSFPITHPGRSMIDGQMEVFWFQCFL